VNILLEQHSLARARERGANKNEILDVIKTGRATSAKYGKMAKYKIYEFNKNWLGKHYDQKMVKVFYTLKKNTIITVTVYVFYGNWGN
jgi:ribosomal protein S8E